MPKKLAFEEKEGKAVYEIIPFVKEKNYQSYISLPAELGRKFKGKKVRVTIEEIK